MRVLRACKCCKSKTPALMFFGFADASLDNFPVVSKHLFAALTLKRRRARRPSPFLMSLACTTMLACPRTGLLARRAKILERAWVRVAREAVGADGQVVPQQWLAHTTAPNVDPADRRRLDLVIYGATPLGGALCCDATLVSPLTRTGQPQPCAAATYGAALRMAERCKRAAYPELSMGGAQRLVVLGTEVGRGSVAPRARSGPGQGPAPARPPNCCQGRLVAKVVVPVGSLSAAGRCCHSIGQYVVGAGLRQPGAWPRARPGSQLGRVVGTQPIAAAVGSR